MSYGTNQKENVLKNNHNHMTILYHPRRKQATKFLLQTLRLKNCNTGSSFSQISCSSMVMQLASANCTP